MLAWLLACGAPEGAIPAADLPDEADAAASTGVPRGALAFRFPLLEVDKFEQTVGVDHDPEVHGDGAEAIVCTAYDGRSFPWCYDEHDGSDYLLVGGFDTMDAGSATIVAAAPGVVVEVVDGNYDRCHATVDGVDCDGWPMVANKVVVEHEGGWQTRYLHMMSGSVVVAVGQEVACGEKLGLVGSSGYSSTPHLHFELQDADGVVIDPYAGAYSQPETWWVGQGDAEGLPVDLCDGE